MQCHSMTHDPLDVWGMGVCEIKYSDINTRRPTYVTYIHT